MICFRDSAWKDYLDWQQTNRRIVQRINSLIKDIQRHPFEGIGKPKPLKFNLTGLWSRHIDEEHRLVYAAEGNDIVIIQCRYHY